MSMMFDANQRQALLALARTVINNEVRHRRQQPTPCPDPAFEAAYGCFVTIKRHGQLRGCIGTFRSDLPLWRNVAQMAAAAATGDPRFQPMDERELADFSLEISVLSPMQRVNSVAEIEVGRHGLYLEKGPYRGVLLPQVATEYGWDRDTFLRQTCHKAGLPADAWQSDKCHIYTFSAEVFGEADEEAC